MCHKKTEKQHIENKQIPKDISRRMKQRNKVHPLAIISTSREYMKCCGGVGNPMRIIGSKPAQPSKISPTFLMRFCTKMMRSHNS